MNALTQSAMPASTAATVPLLRTLVLCDLVDSTALVERLGDQRAAELIRKHDRVVRALLPMRGGREIDKTDGFLAMFDRPIQAVAFALDYQRGLRELNANEKTSLGARVGIHVGDVVTWDNTPDDIAKGAKLTEVEGLVKPITSRLMQLALPGQILLSGVAFSLAHRAQGELGERLSTVRWRTHGRYRFKGIPDPIPVFEVGEEGHAPLKPPPWSGKAHREVPFWRRPATVVVEGALVLALVAIPLWYVFKPAPAIAFANRDWVVVGDLKNLTGQASFDESLETAFRIGLEQSRYVNVLSDLKTRETVKLMQRDPEQTQIDRAVGSEVAIRDGARALILPTVAEIGGRVRVTAEVIDPQTQTTVYSESADGVGEGSVLPSLDKVNQQLRVRLGEALATVSNESQPLDRAATKNLDALRAYTLGRRAGANGNFKESLGYYQRALQLDPDFALAHMELAREFDDAGQTTEAARELASAAAMHDRLAPRDSYYVEALQANLGPPVLAQEKWKQLTALYPDFFSAHGAYAYSLWQQANDYAAALVAIRPSTVAKNPYNAASRHLLAVLLLGSERYDEALQEFAQLSGVTVTQFKAAAYASKRDYGKADSALAAGGDSDASKQTIGAVFAVDRGQLQTGLAALDKLAASSDTASVRNARRVTAGALSLRSIFEPVQGSLGREPKYLATLQRMAVDKANAADADDIDLHVLLTAYLAARQNDLATARAALAVASRNTRDTGYPVLNHMRMVAEAQLAIAEGRAPDAIALLKPLLTGTEPYVSHVVLMDAYAAKTDYAAALEQAAWLAAHRGRAYTEYDSEWLLMPFNVAYSNLSTLSASEYLVALGKKQEARDALRDFRSHWGATDLPKTLMTRIERLETATR